MRICVIYSARCPECGVGAEAGLRFREYCDNRSEKRRRERRFCDNVRTKFERVRGHRCRQFR
ncbi:hypothetical protein BAUCODRAFT_30269 [Baudoinia panamericana UAMH 10762]|uniref:Uncharacterized protein n=1 Tax=Baudoinia panamericana (strain UAMH 10762) TaxID=717646 RepID=M2NL28_BAUPA|nr:uncharacterized protein BAUCODRAFT_30269 [Baudoinia panamericana UAMH 10762]EMC99855.1 hypothetical protein BAUCODRAFT_30269 [Baudoinia panamericana UAMH 10762]